MQRRKTFTARRYALRGPSHRNSVRLSVRISVTVQDTTMDTIDH